MASGEYTFYPKFSDFVTMYRGVVEVWIGDGHTAGDVGVLYAEYIDGVTQRLGPVSSYACALQEGYTGTQEQWIQHIAETSQRALDAEAWAVGKRNDVPVEEGDQTYRNNSMYWNSQAAQNRSDALDAQHAAEVAQSSAETAQIASEEAQSKSEAAQAASEAAQSAAETAQAAAEAAQTAAETARTGAESAQSAAETAQSKAEEAQSNAETAQAAAEEAQGKAEEAQSNAETAQAAAEEAQGKAEEAQQHAEAAQEYAEQALEDTITAKNTAIQAKDNAVDAQLASELARDSSISAKTESESARDASVSAKNDAVTAMTTAVSAKDAAITAKNAAETAESNAISAQNIAISMRDQAVTAKDESISAKDSAISARDTALLYQTGAEQARDAAQAAQTAAEVAGSHYPRITLNKNWEIWNVEQSQWMDSGSRSFAEAVVSVKYQNSISGSTPPIGEWTNVPDPQNGRYLWAKVTFTWNTDVYNDIFMVNYIGANGTGSVNSVNGLGGDIILDGSNINVDNSLTVKETILSAITRLGQIISNSQIDSLFE